MPLACCFSRLWKGSASHSGWIALLAGLALSLSAFAQSGTGCAAARYKLVPIPLRPAYISNTGFVAGTTTKHLAAVWSKEKGLHEAPLPPGFTISEGLGVNDSGALVAVANTPDGSQRIGFIFENGKIKLVKGGQSKSAAINDAGDIVGESVLPGKPTSGPALWKHGDLIDLGACCGGNAAAINPKGQIVGQTYDKQGHYHAFLTQQGQPILTIDSTDDYSVAVAINDLGHIVVQAFPANYIFRDGKLDPLTLSPKFPSHPWSINHCDAVVGSFGPHSDALQAFIWDKTAGFQDLNKLIEPAPGWKLEGASGINDKGEIVGWGDFKGQEDSGFLLLPQ